MNKIQELILELCPNGVEYVKLNTLLKYEQPTKYIVKSTQYNNAYTTPVLTAGQSFILGYTNETNGIYNANKDNPVIIFDDFTTSFHWVDFNFKVKSSAMKMLKPLRSDILLRYVFYAMKNIDYKPGTHSRQWIEKYSNLTIPLPPIEIQEEIVRILDAFAELTAELTAELSLRKKEYRYYRKSLLSYKKPPEYGVRLNKIQKMILDFCPNGVEYVKLNELLEYEQPTKYIVKSTQYNNSYITPVLTAGQSFVLGYTNETDGVYNANKKNPVIIFDDFTTSFHWVDFNFKVKSSAMKMLKPLKSDILLRYVFYAMKNIDYKPGTHSRQWIEKYSNLTIPLPPIEIQEAIVKILDQYDTLCYNMEEGIPAEIKLRQKEFKYYQKMLLTLPTADEIMAFSQSVSQSVTVNGYGKSI